MSRKRIAIIGSTGSVGMNACDIARRNPDCFDVVVLAVGSNVDKLNLQSDEFSPEAVYVDDEIAAQKLSATRTDYKVYRGDNGLENIIDDIPLDLIVAASSGSKSLSAILKAVKKGINIALANKELLVMAGHLVVRESAVSGAKIIPVDSEHNAIFQCLEGSKSGEEVTRLILTGSGGPLRSVPVEDFSALSKETVLNHPKWSMGPKITTDSATMMNKGLEFIEACWLFNVNPESIRIMIHPQAIIHSMVEFRDGSVLAHLGNTDMRLPLLHAMYYPDRGDEPDFSMDWTKASTLELFDPEEDKFPCLKMAKECAADRFTTMPAILNAADEVAVEAFLDDKIRFVHIAEVIQRCLKFISKTDDPSLEQVFAADQETRALASEICREVVGTTT